MKLVRKMKYAGPVVLLSLLFAVPALAQFEVSPDHFDNSQATNKKKPVRKAMGHQTAANTTKQSGGGRSSTSSTTTEADNTGGQATQPSSVAKASGANVAKLQQKKRPTSPAQRLSAKATSVSPE